MYSPPTSLAVRVIAWLAILGGLWLVLGAAASLVVAWYWPPPPETTEAPPGVALFYGVFRHIKLVVLLHAVGAVTLVWAGVGLLRLKAWARAVLEGACWFGLLYFALVGAVWWLIWQQFPELPQDNPDWGQATERMEIALMALTLLAMATPVAVILVYLRSGTVRALLRQD